MDKIAVVYCLYSNDYDNDNIYIGTTRDLRSRLSLHKHRAIHNKIPTLYPKFGELGFDVEILEEFECIEDYDLKKIERKYIEESPYPTLNSKLPTRTRNEWKLANLDHYNKVRRTNYKQNRVYLLDKKKQWYYKNRTKILAKSKEKRQIKKLLLS